MSSNRSKTDLTFFCPTHKSTFYSPRSSSAVMCTVVPDLPHALGDSFPFGGGWRSCCSCLSFWPSDFARTNRIREQCPVCERSIAARYLCDKCKAMALESADPPRQREFMILTGWPVTPSCPGCLIPTKAAVLAHQCETLGVAYTTALRICPYCEEPIKRTPTTQKSVGAVEKEKAAAKEQKALPSGKEYYQPPSSVKPAPIKPASTNPTSLKPTPSPAPVVKTESDKPKEPKTVAEKPIAPLPPVEAPSVHKPKARHMARYIMVVGILIAALLVGTFWFLLRETRPAHVDYKSLSLAKTLSGHANEVTSVALSSDRNILASGGTDAKVIIWNTLTGEMKSLSGNEGGVNAVAFSPDGETLVSGGKNSKVRIWNARTGELKRELTDHEDSITSLAFSPDGETLASGSADHKVILWEAETGVVKFRLRRHEDRVNSIAFSPDSKLLATAGKDKTIKVWEAATGELKSTITRHTDEVTSVAFSPDGNILASGSADFSVVLWDVRTWDVKNALKHRDQVRSVIFSPDSSVLVTGSKDHMVRIWNVQAGELERTLADSGGAINSLAFSRNGKILVSGSNDSSIRVWEAIDDAPITARAVRWLKGLDMVNPGVVPGICIALTLILTQQQHNRFDASYRSSAR
jgi:uncharacterized protein with WD repeat